jgi:tetratricopeptide (TPR) repeat protein
MQDRLAGWHRAKPASSVIFPPLTGRGFRILLRQSQDMPRKQINPTLLIAAIFCIDTAFPVLAQNPAPAAPVLPVVASPATLNRLFSEAEAAFGTQNYDTAIAKIEELLKLLGPGKDAPYELLYFNLGLANLLGGKLPEAEAAFQDCIKRYPKGEYASRCHLGLGRARMMQNTPEKKSQAVEALKVAALDPKYRSEAGLWLGQVYDQLGKKDEALKVFRSLMGSDVRTPQQTTAAVEVIGLLADTGKIEDLTAYLDRLSSQAGVRDAIAWFANQVVVRGDELVANNSYAAALVIYRSVPPRSQILEIQSAALESMRKGRKLLETRVEAEKTKPINQRSNASELLNALVPAITLAEGALKAIQERDDLDAALLMRRGRCLFYLNRYEEALVCFRTIRTDYASSSDAASAAYAEIVIYNKLANIPEIQDKCDLFMRKYPDSDKIEQVATLAGEVLVQSGNWKEVRNFYRRLETKFPQSESLDRYIFFQALASFQDANFAESTPLLEKFLKQYPNSPLVENALYYLAMSNFLSNKYKETLASCREYLAKFPDGRYAGDMRYRLSFIDFNDKEEDQSAKIIRDLSEFLKNHPEDLSNGSMYCLMADTYKRMGKQDEALDSYIKAVWTESPDDVLQYALDSATTLLQDRKDWAAIAKLHADFMQRKPDSQLALMSATWVAKMKIREGKGAEAAGILANSLKTRIANPASEQVEFLIDELVKTLVPRKKPKDIDADAIDKELMAILEKLVAGQENITTNARIYYARARLAQLLRRNDRADLYFKGIATTNAQDPSGLSPALLATSGDILLKNGDLDGAQAMFMRLTNRYSESIFSDAGPVGMGYVALARNQPEEALRMFDEVLEKNPGTSRFKETTLGKLEALVALGKYDDAIQLALQIVGDKMFRGETAAKAYLLLGQAYRAKSAKAAGDEATELLKKAHGTYQRVYVAYQAFPDVCAEAYMQAYETAKQLGEDQLAEETLKALKGHPKLQNTAQAKKAATMAN